nr:hypothetical protein BaRGS_014170 [Batillaria attramentaria]
MLLQKSQRLLCLANLLLIQLTGCIALCQQLLWVKVFSVWGIPVSTKFILPFPQIILSRVSCLKKQGGYYSY